MKNFFCASDGHSVYVWYTVCAGVCTGVCSVWVCPVFFFFFCRSFFICPIQINKKKNEYAVFCCRFGCSERENMQGCQASTSCSRGYGQCEMDIRDSHGCGTVKKPFLAHGIWGNDCSLLITIISKLKLAMEMSLMYCDMNKWITGSWTETLCCFVKEMEH